MKICTFLLILISVALCQQRLTNQQRVDLVNAHNSARSQVSPTANNMQRMQWDDNLEQFAVEYVSGCPSDNGAILNHNPNLDLGYPGPTGEDNSVGENIFASSSSSIDPTEAVTNWVSEGNGYTLSTNDCTMSTCLHYTQVVWADSNRLGCAYVSCPNLQLESQVLCNYAPAGNINAGRPYTQGTSGTSDNLIDNNLLVTCTSPCVPEVGGSDCSGFVCTGQESSFGNVLEMSLYVLFFWFFVLVLF